MEGREGRQEVWGDDLGMGSAAMVEGGMGQVGVGKKV